MFTEFEDIATFWIDRMLTETRVREFFGQSVILIKSNESTMKILEDAYKEDRINNYNNLMKLIKRSDSCGYSAITKVQ